MLTHKHKTHNIYTHIDETRNGAYKIARPPTV